MILGVGRGPIPSQGPSPRRQQWCRNCCCAPSPQLTPARPALTALTAAAQSQLAARRCDGKDGYTPALTDYRPSHQRPIQVHLSPSFLLHPFDLTIIRLKLSIRANRILLWLLSHIYLYQRNLPQSTRRLNCVKPLGRGYGLNMFFCPLFSICNSG